MGGCGNRWSGNRSMFRPDIIEIRVSKASNNFPKMSEGRNLIRGNGLSLLFEDRFNEICTIALWLYNFRSLIVS